MKDIFKDQPVIGEGEDKFLAKKCANWGTINIWLRGKPTLPALKKAALYEAENGKRVQILDRILSRIFKLEKVEALNLLLK